MEEIWGEGEGQTVIAFPPVKGAFPDEKIEEKAYDEPEGVLCCVSISFCIFFSSFLDSFGWRG